MILLLNIKRVRPILTLMLYLVYLSMHITQKNQKQKIYYNMMTNFKMHVVLFAMSILNMALFFVIIVIVHIIINVLE